MIEEINACWNRHGHSVPTPPDLDSLRGAYTTIKVEGHAPVIPFFLEDHLERVFDSLRLMGIESELDQSIVSRGIHSFLKQFQSPLNHKLRVFLNQDLLALRLSSILNYAEAFAGVPMVYERADPKAKSTRKGALKEAREKIDPCSQEIVLISSRGEILEGSSSNLILVQGQNWIVRSHGVLGGITLKKLLEEVERQTNIHVQEAHVPLSQLQHFEEILVLGTTKEVRPLLSLESFFVQKNNQALHLAQTLYQNAKERYKQRCLEQDLPYLQF